MSDKEGGSSSSAAPRRTYGRSKVVTDEPATSMVFAPQQASTSISSAPAASPSKNLLDRFSAKSSNWRESLVELDASREDEVDEDEIMAARERFRKSNARDDQAPGPGRMLSAFSSSTLTEPPSSTPPLTSKTSEAVPLASSPPTSPPPSAPPSSHARRSRPSSSPTRIEPAEAESEDEGEGDITITVPVARTSVTPVGSPPGSPMLSPSDSPAPDLVKSLFDDDDGGDDEPAAGAEDRDGSVDIDLDEAAMQPLPRPPKGLSKAEAEQAHRDAARALREREAALSKPEPTRRPLSEWLAKANLVASSTFDVGAASQPGTSPSDIGHFSSARKDKSDRLSSQEQLEGPIRPPSSPTPRVYTKPNHTKKPSIDLDDEDDPASLADALDKHSTQMDQKNAWAEIKAQALKAQAKPRVKAEDEDEDDFFIIPDEPRGSRQGPMSKMRAALERPASNKPKLPFGSAPNKRAGKLPITETHMNFAAQYGHGNMKQVNGGARPSGQKPGRDTAVTHKQMSSHISSKVHQQSYQAQLKREEKYGHGRRLPEREKLNITFKPSDAPEEESDESDSDFAPDEDGEGDVEGDDEGEGEAAIAWSGDEEDAAPPSSAVQVSLDEDEELGSELDADVETDDGDKENRPLVPASVSDDEDDLQPIKKRPVRTRVTFMSDDEGDDEGEAGVHDQSLREATQRPPGTAALGSASGPSLSGFAFDDDADFSQMFADTQAGGDEGDEDGFAAIRDKAPAPGALEWPALLPSVWISESQRRRDNALVGEADELGELVEERSSKQYLNSQGFFTQTRPSDHASQLVSSGLAHTQIQTQLGTSTQLGTDTGNVAPSSTLINSSDRPSDPTSPTLVSVEETTFTRLRRRQHSRTPSPEASPEPALHQESEPENEAPRARNAFDLLNAGARHQAKPKGQSDLIDAQAEESDDETGWGFLSKEADEDEDADEGYVPELVDDVAVSDDVREAQDALATEKHRAIAAEDDARREAVAKKVTEGHYRHKRRGNEFMSDDEDEDAPRLSKKQRRQRRLDREDKFKLGDEASGFLKAYEDSSSDSEEEETPLSPSAIKSPEGMSARERDQLLRQRARMNTNAARMDVDDDKEEESLFLVSRVSRSVRVEHDDDDEISITRTRRTVESYSKFVSDESQNPRRNGGGGGVSVVVQKNSSKPSSSRPQKSGSGANKALGRSSGSVLFNRDNRFGK